jgi:hypothetical protein
MNHYHQYYTSPIWGKKYEERNRGISRIHGQKGLPCLQYLKCFDLLLLIFYS